ncbi:MAG: nucleotidyltransferase domain-containing protein [Coriobacteriia bacterium]|nr:nucleotidyltransferase domain-containing protein [Coriobacteriia bacterium]
MASIFATPTLAALLAVFAREPERRFYQKELVELTDSSLYLVQRELKRLERAGLIARMPRGRQVEYEVNSAHPAFAGLRDALLRTFALGDRIRVALQSVQGVRLTFIFGSVARGEDRGGSDLDLLVVGDLSLREASAALVPVLRDLGREPNIVVLSITELRERVQRGEHFMGTVLGEPKLWVMGDDEQLAAILG